MKPNSSVASGVVDTGRACPSEINIQHSVELKTVASILVAWSDDAEQPRLVNRNTERLDVWSTQEAMDPLDVISMGVFSYLRKHPRVSHLDNKAFVGATTVQVSVWDQKNHPCVLPEDLKRFYTLTNGLSVKWFALFRGQSTLVGHFALNSVQDLQRCRVENFARLCRPPDIHRIGHVHGDATATAFPLESSPQYGDVALVFFPGTEYLFVGAL
jgi:hypothetical protein